jgi:hypothetical protein
VHDAALILSVREELAQALDQAQEFTASVDYADFDACVRELERRNAFRESEEARLVMQAARPTAKP